MILVSDLGAVVYGTSLWLVLIVLPGAVTWLKGQRALFWAGLLLMGLVWSVAALRLARPNSWWATRFYGERKLLRARRRYAAG